MKEISFERLKPEPTQEAPKSVERSQGSAVAPVMRTFGTDVREMMRDEQITKTQVIMAEAARREERGESRTVHDEDSHLTQIIAGLFVVLAIGIGLAFYVLFGTSPDTAETPTPLVIERTERSTEVDVTNDPREGIIAKVGSTYNPATWKPGEVRTIAFVYTNTEGDTRDVSANELFVALVGQNLPSTLARSLGNTVLLSIEGASVGSPLNGEFSLTSQSPANTIAGMYEWEDTVAIDLLPVLNPRYPRGAFSTLLGRAWETRRMGGIDVRTLADVEGDVVIAYALLNRKLYIAGNIAMIESAIARKVDGVGE